MITQIKKVNGYNKHEYILTSDEWFLLHGLIQDGFRSCSEYCHEFQSCECGAKLYNANLRQALDFIKNSKIEKIENKSKLKPKLKVKKKTKK